MNLLALREIYCIGIKGAGMTALAELLLRQGIRISGSDTAEVFYTDAILERLGILVHQSFAATQLPTSAEAVIYSTAYTPENNVELQQALKSGKPVFSYPEALGLITQTKLTLAICGTHGKTTTSALLAEALRQGGLAPSAIVGSEISAWGGGALSGTGKYLVIEADEYQDKLRFYHPLAVILTSVDWDHPDFFPTIREYEAVFARFVGRIPRHGVLIASGDDARVLAITKSTRVKVLTYGFHEESDVRIQEATVIDPESSEGQKGMRQTFVAISGGRRYGPFSLRLAGKHNAKNAGAVIALFLHFKLPLDQLGESLKSFAGTKRRFEYYGEYQRALIFDDYAHHPDEIRVTLGAFRELYPKRRLIVVFHPHTFTRTKALLGDFVEALALADQVLLLDIYGSAREVQGGVSSQDLVERINTVFPDKALHIADHFAVEAYLRQILVPTDILVTMGAGDVWRIAQCLTSPTVE